MSLMHSEYAARVNHWMRVLAEDFYRPLGEITLMVVPGERFDLLF